MLKLNMKTKALAAAAACLVALPVYADNHTGLNLDNLDLGASIRVRGNNFDLDDAASDLSFVEQNTRLNFGMNVDDAVQTMVELQSYDTWGEDFRSDPILGAKGRASTSDDVEVYQAWFEVGGDSGTLRVGRQEMMLGSEWLVGNGSNNSFFTGLSFDGFRASKQMGDLTVDAFVTKVAEGFDSFGDNDTDFSGVYATYGMSEDITLDGYWMWLRDDGNFSTSLGATSTDIHTIGGRFDGTFGGLNLETEVAYQTGSAEVNGGSDLDVAALGVNTIIGYGLDSAWSPYFFYNLGYFQGASNDELAFNRLFSDYSYTQYDLQENFSNHFAHVFGVQVTPCEAVEVGANLTYLVAEEVAAGADDELGLELHLWTSYQYSEHLMFKGGWAMFEAGDGIGTSLVANNATSVLGGDEDSTFQYLYLESELTF